MHPQKFNDLMSHIATEKVESKNNKRSAHNDQEASSSGPKQPKVTDLFQQPFVRKSQFEKLVVGAVIGANLSASIVDNPSVKKLLEAGFPKYHIGRNTVTARIENDYMEIRSLLTKSFEKISLVCLTADCWSSYRR